MFNMNREELETGYLVEMRGRYKALVYPVKYVGRIRLELSTFDEAYIGVEDLTENLYAKSGNNNFDIMKVWGLSPDFRINLDEEGRELLWERKKYPKLTSGETIILETILTVTDFRFVARDHDEEVIVHEYEPEKDSFGDFSSNGDYVILADGYEVLSNFATLGNNCYSIRELLDNQ